MGLTEYFARVGRIRIEAGDGATAGQCNRYLVFGSSRSIGRLNTALASPNISREVFTPERVMYRQNQTIERHVFKTRFGTGTRQPFQIGKQIGFGFELLPVGRQVRPLDGCVVFRA